MKRFLILFAVVANLVLADAVTKELARGYLRGEGASCPRVIEVIPGFFNLAYVENRGCAWGMFQGQVWPLAVFGIIALAFLIWKRKSVFNLPTSQSSKLPNLGAVAEPLLYAGIIGNVIDRLFRGYVIDMFDFHWGIHHFPCFNVADSLICVSIGLILLMSGASCHPSDLGSPRDTKVSRKDTKTRGGLSCIARVSTGRQAAPQGSL